MPNYCTVIRPFDAAHPLHAGDVVDVATWRLAPQLMQRRYIRPATIEEIAAVAGPADAPRVPTRGRKVPEHG